jgi:GNAT superfamily N-acetyltransferase
MAVDAIAKACEEAFGYFAHSRDPMETMILEEMPRPAVGVPGVLRHIASDSKLLPILALWFEQFEKDTHNESYCIDGSQQVLPLLRDAANRKDLFTWEVKDKPVAMLILGRLEPKQVLCVYAPPHQRGRGFGQAVTAAACAERWQMTGGTEPITLSAASPAAARVYERVGFRSGGWIHGVTFEDHPCDDKVAQACISARSMGAASDVDTDAETDGSQTSAETDAETDVEAEDADEEVDLEAEWWDFDLETDSAALFAAHALVECS